MKERQESSGSPPSPTTHLAGPALDALPLGVVIHDLAGRAVLANHQAAAILGLDPAVIAGRRPVEYLAAHPEAARAIGEEIELAIAAGDRPAAQRRLLRLRLGGKERALSLATRKLADPATGAAYLALVIDDIGPLLADIASLPALQAHTEKMATLGDLLSGVAHEINTPLGALNSNHDIFMRSTMKLRELTGRLDDEMRPAFDRIIQVFDELNRVNADALRRILKLVGGLRSFARREEGIERVDIHDRIDDSLALIEHQTKNRIEVVRQYGKDVPEMSCIPNLVSQVFLNILVNAVHAIEGKGRITIRTGRQQGGMIRIDITDTGRGIPSEIIGRIFEPGFTTKQRGTGTGLGLPISRRIVDRHGGRIEVESQVGKGSTFSIILPERCPEAGQPGEEGNPR